MKGARPLLQHRAERCLHMVLLAAEPWLIATAAGEGIKERSEMIVVNTQHMEKGSLTKDATISFAAGIGKAIAQSHLARKVCSEN